MLSNPRVEPESLLRPGIAEIYPASLAQRRLWFLNQLQPESAAYNVHVGLWLYGTLDLDALQASLQDTVDRHECLRTTFALARSGDLLQIVSRSSAIHLPIKDFSDLPEPYPSAYAFAKQEVERPFDLSKGPLLRSWIMRINAEEHVLLCTMHHTITDAWSLQIFAKEVAAFYEARVSGQTADLPELTVQYGDYSEWQNVWLRSEIAQQELAYWKENLADAPAVLELVGDAPRPAEQTLGGQTKTLAVPAEIMVGVVSLAKERQVTPFMILLAAFKVLLYRYSEQPDILVGVPVAGRSRIETEPMIGFFVDTVVLRDNLSDNPPFMDLLTQVRQTTVNALAHADMPFEKVVEALRPERNLSYNPIFQVMFSVIKSAIRSHSFGNIVAYPYVVEPSTSILDLGATFIEDSDGKWWLEFDFNTSLFKYERILQMFNDFMVLLRQIVEQPAVHVDELAFPGRLGGARLAKSAGQCATQPKLNHQPVAATRQTQPLSAAGNAEQELLVEIWKDVLGVDTIGVHDNFFDVGGHSLLAARLTAQIREVTGRAVPVSAIFRSPTIATLATLLRSNTIPQQDSPILQLREGENRIGFFAVAAPGVDSLGYAVLARNLGEQDSMYKLQGTGAGVWGRPFRKDELRELAREYIRAMRSVQPHGPFCLGGMCDGVLIAQEMILQLESEGEKVALFTILDTWVLENSQIRALWAINYYLGRVRSFPRMPRVEQLAILRRTLRRWGGSSDGSRDWPQTYWPGEDFEAPAFRAPIMLFKRRRQPYYYVRDPEMGWGNRTAGGVEIHEVNCGHYELLRLPHVQSIGQKLSLRLRNINDQARTEAKAFSEGRILAQEEKLPFWTPPTVTVVESASQL